MVYKKRGVGRRARKFRKYPRTGASSSKALYLAKKALSKIPRPERKYALWSTSTSVGTSGSMFDLLPLFNKGTNEGEFVGNKVELKNISLRFMVRRQGATPVVYRCIIFRYWEENGGSVPTALQILSTNDVLSYKNQDQLTDSTFMHDRAYDFSNIAFHAATSGNTDVQRYHKLSYDIQKFSHRPYKVNNGNSVESGGLYLYIVATDNITVTGQAITYYTDA